ncbi:hypothetical protein [Christiangramia echinicola]|uniref:hypothetical protein n=1 Tax=Christiangramia echinicola TaxID=279359 RepID=UPI00042382EA|nr:hypothetical protein [Christiangramia echinicola]
MARNNGILKIEGTLQDLTFYKGQDGYLVKTKSGVSRKRILRDPAFARTRENLAEFTDSAKAGKMLRLAMNELMQQAKDNRVTSRLMQKMSGIQKLDSVNLRGKRTVQQGLTTEEGKALLENFNFNERAPMESILLAQYNVDEQNGDISIAGFIPGLNLYKPEGATHVSLRSAFISVNFSTGKFSGGVSPAENLIIDMSKTDVLLVPDSVPSGAGNVFILLLVEFYQMVNNTQYPLRNGAHNSLSILSVG